MFDIDIIFVSVYLTPSYCKCPHLAQKVLDKIYTFIFLLILLSDMEWDVLYERIGNVD